MKSQKERILDYIRTHGGITNEAAAKMGIYRLSARIFDLREDGIKIVTETVKKKSLDGTGVTYGLYREVSE